MCFFFGITWVVPPKKSHRETVWFPMSWVEYIDQVMNSGNRLVFCRTAWRTPAVQLFLVPGIWEARDCCLILYVTINMTVGWGGVGGWVWGGLKRFICTRTHTSCHATVRPLALAHICHAMHLADRSWDLPRCTTTLQKSGWTQLGMNTHRAGHENIPAFRRTWI